MLPCACDAAGSTRAAARAEAMAMRVVVIFVLLGDDMAVLYITWESLKLVRQARQRPALARRLRAPPRQARLGPRRGAIDDRPSHHVELRECRQGRHRRERDRAGENRRDA